MMAADTSGAPSPPIDRTWSVRDAEGDRDAFYLQRLWHHWFGGEYESQRKLQFELFPVAGWPFPEDADTGVIDSYGAIAEHTPTDREARVAVGAGLVCHLTREETLDSLPPGRFDPEALVGETNAWLMFNVVDEEWHGEGIGRELLRRRLEWARDTDAEMAFACGWERRDGRASHPLLDAAGFVPVQRIDGMYAESGRTSCPDCGIWPSDDEPCRCDATLWAMDLA